MKGLSLRKTADAIAEFVNKHGASAPRRAVLCTYDLDPRRFEAEVLPELTRRRKWFRTLVLADQAALQKNGVLRQRSAESTYELEPVRLKSGVFHPKLMVLQAGEHVLVGIGSGNLTVGGLGGNLELMLFAANDSAQGRTLAGSAMQFLHDLSRAGCVVVPAQAKLFLKRLCVWVPRSAGGPVLHNLDERLVDQLEKGRPARVQRAAVMSPWHSSSASPEGVEPVVLQAVQKAFGARPVVYTEGHNGSGPNLGARVQVRVLKRSSDDASEDLVAGDDDDQSASASRRSTKLHAKAYLAVGIRDATLWFGSANCTSPALLHTAKRLGNVEILAQTKLGRAGLAAFELDLRSMFDDRKGLLDPKPKTRIPVPRGHILSAYVSRWRDKPRMTLELAEASTKTRTLRIARSANLASAIIVKVPGGKRSVVLDATAIAKLLDDWSSVLWEHVGSIAIPFPVSVPCLPIAYDPDEALEDELDELAGRLPAAFSSRNLRGRPYRQDLPEDDELEGNERDRELELLSKTKHQGSLDRRAVRVELLRRRLEAAGRGSAEVLAHYRSIVETFAIAPSLKRLLVDHLGAARSAR